MKQICSYISFNGNCREAMFFYKECLGGDLAYQTIGDSPLADQLPKSIQSYILQARLQLDQLILMGTDIPPEEGRIAGNNFSLYLHFNDEAELRSCYHKLAKSSISINPPDYNYWGNLTGSITDQYGVNWLFNCGQINKNSIFQTETKPTR